MDNENLLQSTAEASAKLQRDAFIETFISYGLLAATMTPEQLACEIGVHFRDPHQSAIVTTLMARLIALETRLGAE